MAVTAAGLGAFVIESATGRIAWRAAQPLARAVDANARFALLALEDGTGERVDLTQRVRVSGSLGDPSPRVVAIDANGTRALVAGEHGTARWLDLSAEHWPAISTRAFHELEAADALATREDEFVVAASRLGFVTSATAAFANAPPAFYARHILEAEYAGPHRALLVDDHCAVWQSECTNTQCAADILVPEGHGCTVARVDANFTITTFPIPLLGLNDRRHGETGVLLYTVDRGGSTPAGIAIDDDAIVIAGPPIDPWLRRIALPPREPDAFDRWVAERTNATIGPYGGVVFRGP